jgi:hypothetical protein
MWWYSIVQYDHLRTPTSAHDVYCIVGNSSQEQLLHRNINEQLLGEF